MSAVGHAVLTRAVAFALAATATPIIGFAQAGGAQACLSIVDNTERLACYDREIRKLVQPSFSGRLSKTTDLFHISSPTRLRYQSDGPIFVLYLKSADGAVVQNLHIGGGGEASYRIEQPGTYFLDVSGSESWRIWIEPDPTQTTN